MTTTQLTVTKTEAPQAVEKLLRRLVDVDPPWAVTISSPMPGTVTATAQFQNGLELPPETEDPRDRAVADLTAQLDLVTDALTAEQSDHARTEELLDEARTEIATANEAKTTAERAAAEATTVLARTTDDLATAKAQITDLGYRPMDANPQVNPARDETPDA